MNAAGSMIEDATVTVLRELATGGVLDDDTAALLAAHPQIDVISGQHLQLAVLDRLRADGAELGGWKIGWTSRGARTGAGAAGDRPFGYVMRDRIRDSGDQLDPSRIPGCKIEAEIAVRIGTDLRGPNVTPEQARAAIDALAPAFEVCSSRLRPGMSLAVRLGNALNNWGIVVGSPVSPDGVELAAIGVEFFIDGEPSGTGSAGLETVDDPYVSVAGVANLLATHGLSLSAGEWLITGSLLAPTPVEAGRRYEARFDQIGTVAVGF
jgi:2-keto-4-pentenoate hydratase